MARFSGRTAAKLLVPWLWFSFKTPIQKGTPHRVGALAYGHKEAEVHHWQHPRLRGDLRNPGPHENGSGERPKVQPNAGEEAVPDALKSGESISPVGQFSLF